MSKIKYEDTLLLKDKIQSTVNIRDVLIDHGVDLKDHSSGTKGMACCPFHSENNPSFSVDYQKGVYNCFSCHESGDMFTFIGVKHGLNSWNEIIEFICSNYGVSITKDGKVSIDEEIKKLFLINQQKNYINVSKHRDRFDRIILEVYQKINLCLELKNADNNFIEKTIFPIFKDIDKSIESDKFDYQFMEDLGYELDKKIDKLRRKENVKI